MEKLSLRETHQGRSDPWKCPLPLSRHLDFFSLRARRLFATLIRVEMRWHQENVSPLIVSPNKTQPLRDLAEDTRTLSDMRTLVGEKSLFFSVTQYNSSQWSSLEDMQCFHFIRPPIHPLSDQVWMSAYYRMCTPFTLSPSSSSETQIDLNIHVFGLWEEINLL